MGLPGTSNKIGRNLMTIESNASLQRSAKISPSKTSSLGFLSFHEDYNSRELCTGLPVKLSERGRIFSAKNVKGATPPHPHPL